MNIINIRLRMSHQLKCLYGNITSKFHHSRQLTAWTMLKYEIKSDVGET